MAGVQTLKPGSGVSGNNEKGEGTHRVRDIKVFVDTLSL